MTINPAIVDLNDFALEEMGKVFTITVNGEAKIIRSKEVSYADVIALEFDYLAFDDLQTIPDVLFTVTYYGENSNGKNSRGSLFPGGTVMIEDGMIFNVSLTSVA